MLNGDDRTVSIDVIKDKMRLEYDKVLRHAYLPAFFMPAMIGDTYAYLECSRYPSGENKNERIRHSLFAYNVNAYTDISKTDIYERPTDNKYYYVKDVTNCGNMYYWACCVDGTVYQSIDGGFNFTKYTVDSMSCAIDAMYCVNLNVLYAIGTASKKIFATEDGGKTWCVLPNSYTISAAGNSYSVDDIIATTTPYHYVRVTSVNASGAITGVETSEKSNQYIQNNASGATITVDFRPLSLTVQIFGSYHIVIVGCENKIALYKSDNNDTYASNNYISLTTSDTIWYNINRLYLDSPSDTSSRYAIYGGGTGSSLYIYNVTFDEEFSDTSIKYVNRVALSAPLLGRMGKDNVNMYFPTRNEAGTSGALNRCSIENFKNFATGASSALTIPSKFTYTNCAPMCVVARDNEVGYVGCTNNKIYKSTDLGSVTPSWSVIDTEYGDDIIWHYINVIDDNNIISVGSYMTIMTNKNGGYSGYVHPYIMPHSGSLYKMSGIISGLAINGGSYYYGSWSENGGDFEILSGGSGYAVGDVIKCQKGNALVDSVDSNGSVTSVSITTNSPSSETGSGADIIYTIDYEFTNEGSFIVNPGSGYSVGDVVKHGTDDNYEFYTVTETSNGAVMSAEVLSDSAARNATESYNGSGFGYDIDKGIITSKGSGYRVGDIIKVVKGYVYYGVGTGANWENQQKLLNSNGGWITTSGMIFNNTETGVESYKACISSTQQSTPIHSSLGGEFAYGSYNSTDGWYVVKSGSGYSSATYYGNGTIALVKYIRVTSVSSAGSVSKLKLNDAATAESAHGTGLQLGYKAILPTGGDLTRSISWIKNPSVTLALYTVGALDEGDLIGTISVTSDDLVVNNNIGVDNNCLFLPVNKSIFDLDFRSDDIVVRDSEGKRVRSLKIPLFTRVALKFIGSNSGNINAITGGRIDLKIKF